MMTVNHVIGAAALRAAAASSYVGQAEFVAPDTGLRPSMTRAKVDIYFGSIARPKRNIARQRRAMLFWIWLSRRAATREWLQ